MKAHNRNYTPYPCCSDLTLLIGWGSNPQTISDRISRGYKITNCRLPINSPSFRYANFFHLYAHILCIDFRHDILTLMCYQGVGTFLFYIRGFCQEGGIRTRINHVYIRKLLKCISPLWPRVHYGNPPDMPSFRLPRLRSYC